MDSRRGQLDYMRLQCVRTDAQCDNFGVFKGEHAKFIADEISSDSDLWLRDGDILVQRGEYAGVRWRTCCLSGEPNCYIYPDLMMKLRVSSELDTDYLYFAMSSEPARNFSRSEHPERRGRCRKLTKRL